MLLSFLAPLLLVALLLAAWLILRLYPRPWRVAGAAAGWLGLSLILRLSGVSPLLIGPGVPEGPDGHWLRAVGIIWWLLAARLVSGGTGWLLRRGRLSHDARITADLVSALVHLAAACIILNFVLLLPVGGLIATSGVVAVVIGLALQNTLADVFSGIAVGLEGPFAPGDRITLADGLEGVVAEINWRSVRIATDSGDIATVPNSTVAKSQIVNRNVPVRRRAGSISLLRPAADRPDEMLMLLRRAALLTSDVLATPPPIVSMDRLGLHTANYAIAYQVADTPLLVPARTNLLAQVHLLLRYRELRQCFAGEDAQAAGRALVDNVPLFAGLSPKRRAAVADRLRRQPLRGGDVVFAKGTDADMLVVIADGVIAVTGTGPEDRSEPSRHAGPGEAIGDIGLVRGETRSHTARAASDGLIFLLPRDDLLGLIAGDDGLADAMERCASAHIEMLQRTSDADGAALGRMPQFLQALRHMLTEHGRRHY